MGISYFLVLLIFQVAVAAPTEELQSTTEELKETSQFSLSPELTTVDLALMSNTSMENETITTEPLVEEVTNLNQTDGDVIIETGTWEPEEPKAATTVADLVETTTSNAMDLTPRLLLNTLVLFATFLTSSYFRLY